jgi:hypothetical protein
VNRTIIAPLSSAIIALMLAGLVVVGVDRVERGLRPGEARLVVSRGLVEVSVDGAPYVQASRDRILGSSDRVRVVRGSAVLELGRSSVAELREGSAVMVSGGSDPALVLETGDLLVEAPRNTVKVDGGNALVSVAGAAKLRRSSSLVAGVYEGSVLLQSEGQTLGVPRYRQAVAAGTGILPATPRPLDLRATDDWDRRMLGDVISLTEQLEFFGRGFESQLPVGAQVSPQFFKAVLPQLAADPLTPAVLAGRSAGENLIGLVLVGMDRGDFNTRVGSIFGFRADGASWGLVAADRGLNPNPVLSGLESAAGRAVQESAAGGGGSLNLAIGRRGRNGDFAGASPAGSGGSGQAAGPGSGGGGPGSPSRPPGSPSQPPPNQQPPRRINIPPTGTILDPLLSPITGPVANLLNGLLDSLLGPTQQAGVAAAPLPAVTTATAPAPRPAATVPSAPVASAPVASVAPTTTTAAPTPAAPAPSGGLLGGLTSSIGRLLG